MSRIKVRSHGSFTLDFYFILTRILTIVQKYNFREVKGKGLSKSQMVANGQKLTPIDCNMISLEAMCTMLCLQSCLLTMLDSF
jgi:hypothetical protein